MKAIKALFVLACLSAGFTAQAKIDNHEGPNECLHNPGNSACHRSQEEAGIQLRIDNPLLIQRCKADPSLPVCRRLNPTELLVKMPPQEYESLQKLKQKRMLVLDNPNQFYAELNFMLQQERVKNERVFQQLKYSATESKEWSKTIESIRVAVETQQQLDERFGWGGGLKLSLQQGDNQTQPILQQGDPVAKEKRQQMSEIPASTVTN